MSRPGTRTVRGCDSGEALYHRSAEGATRAVPVNLSGKRTEEDKTGLPACVCAGKSSIVFLFRTVELLLPGPVSFFLTCKTAIGCP